jgi:hypothetical protein
VPVLVVTTIIVWHVVDAVEGGLCEGYHCDPIPLSGFLFCFVGPFLVPAAVGALTCAWIGRHIERKVIKTSMSR